MVSRIPAMRIETPVETTGQCPECGAEVTSATAEFRIGDATAEPPWDSVRLPVRNVAFTLRPCGHDISVGEGDTSDESTTTQETQQ